MPMLRHNGIRWFAGVSALLILAAVYLFQQFDFSLLVSDGFSSHTRFVVNRTSRFLINEGACMLLIVAVFNKLDYLRISAMIFLAELLILLPLYFLLKLSLEGDSEISSPLLSQLHRMIINPLLMIVLMMGFFYQDHFSKRVR
jgi:exosortase F-associated protein